jgi:transposase
MRGEERRQRSMLLVVNLEERIPREHPLRRIKQMAELALKDLSPIFDEIYSVLGRPSIPPERRLKASLLMALYTIRSERLFCEQLDLQSVVSAGFEPRAGRAKLRPFQFTA